MSGISEGNCRCANQTPSPSQVAHTLRLPKPGSVEPVGPTFFPRPSPAGGPKTRAAGACGARGLDAPPRALRRSPRPAPAHCWLPLCPLGSSPVAPRLVRACRRVPGLPGTCGLFSRRPPPSRRSERPSTLDGLGLGRGRPLVAAAAVVAAQVVGGTRGSSPARPGASLPDKGVGVPSRTGAPRQAVSRPELSRPTITHEEKPRPRTVRGWFQGHAEGR